ESSTDGREGRRDRFRRPTFVREERARERGTRGASGRRRKTLERRLLLLLFRRTRRTRRGVAERMLLVFLLLRHGCSPRYAASWVNAPHPLRRRGKRRITTVGSSSRAAPGKCSIDGKRRIAAIRGE